MPPKKAEHYFISETQYNCPFCSTAAVRYKVVGGINFDWSKTEQRLCLFIKCQEPSCLKVSFHLTKYNIQYDGRGEMILPYLTKKEEIMGKEITVPWEYEIDDLFFYHHPNSDFVIDDRIPKKIREAFDEAASSHKMGHKIGSSAALRKTIFEILAKFEIPKFQTNPDDPINPKKISYISRLDLLKEKISKEIPSVEIDLIDEIKSVYALVSKPLHEQLPDEEEWEDFTPDQFLFLMTLTQDLLIELFVEIDEREKRRKKLGELNKKIPSQKVTIGPIEKTKIVQAKK
jgi:hypothetical protein